MERDWDISEPGSDPLPTEYGGEILNNGAVGYGWSIDEASEKDRAVVECGGVVDSDLTLKSPPLIRRLLDCSQERLFLFLFLIGFVGVLVSDVVRNQITMEKYLAITMSFLYGKYGAKGNGASRVQARETGAHEAPQGQGLSKGQNEAGNSKSQRKGPKKTARKKAGDGKPGSGQENRRNKRGGKGHE